MHRLPATERSSIHPKARKIPGEDSHWQRGENPHRSSCGPHWVNSWDPPFCASPWPACQGLSCKLAALKRQGSYSHQTPQETVPATGSAPSHSSSNSPRETKVETRTEMPKGTNLGRGSPVPSCPGVCRPAALPPPPYWLQLSYAHTSAHL